MTGFSDLMSLTSTRRLRARLVCELLGTRRFTMPKPLGGSSLILLTGTLKSRKRFIKASWTANLVKYRPHLGLSFMVFHTSHLIFLGLLQFEFHPVFDLAARKALMGGGLAYVFMYMMALTTFPYFKNKLSLKVLN